MEIIESLQSQKLSKENLASMLFESLRESLDIIVNSNIHSVEMIEVYHNKYQGKVSDYNGKILKSFLLNMLISKDFKIDMKELGDFLNIEEDEEQGCEYLYDSIQSYTMGDKEILQSLIKEPLTEKEINNLSIIQLILKDLYEIRSDFTYKQRVRKLVADRLASIQELYQKELPSNIIKGE